MTTSVLTLHPLLAATFSGWAHAGVIWTLLRVPSDLARPQGDIDILVERSHVGRMRRVLHRLGFVQIPGHGYGLHFLSYHKSTGWWLWLHIVTELSFGPYYALKTEAEVGCLTRRQHNAGIATLAPDDAFWALLLHCIVDKSAIAPRHRVRIQELAGEARPDSQLAGVVETVCPPGWSASRILSCARLGDWDVLESLGAALSEAWISKGDVTAWHLRLLRLSRIIERGRSLWRGRGLSVALIGPDGAGKTTLVEAIEHGFVFPVHVIYGGLTGGHLPQVDGWKVPVLVVAGRVGVFWCRYFIALSHQLRGQLVVFDRYIYDAVAPSPFTLSRLGKVYRWLDGHACLPPDLVLLLDVPGEIMHRRKGEYSPQELENWRKHFLSLRGRIRQLQVVPAARDKDSVRVDVFDRIWQRYAARWRAK